MCEDSSDTPMTPSKRGLLDSVVAEEEEEEGNTLVQTWLEMFSDQTAFVALEVLTAVEMNPPMTMNSLPSHTALAAHKPGGVLVVSKRDHWCFTESKTHVSLRILLSAW